MHPGLPANVSLRRLDPFIRPILQRLAAQKPHLLDEPLFGRVRLTQVPVHVPHRAMIESILSRSAAWVLKNANNASSLSFTVAMGPTPSIDESPVYSPQS